MKRSAACVSVGFWAVLAAPWVAQAAVDPVMGDWMTFQGSAKVRVAPCVGNPSLTCGTLLWLKDGKDKGGAPLRDLNNPDAALRNRNLVGVQLISNLRPATTGLWTDGKIYVPESGRTFRVNMSASPDGTLKVEGCVAMVCRARIWTKAN